MDDGLVFAALPTVSKIVERGDGKPCVGEVAPGVVVVARNDVARGIHQAHDAAEAVADGVEFLRRGRVDGVGDGNGVEGAGKQVVHANAPGVGPSRRHGRVGRAVHDHVVAGPNMADRADAEAGTDAAAEHVVGMDVRRVRVKVVQPVVGGEVAAEVPPNGNVARRRELRMRDGQLRGVANVAVVETEVVDLVVRVRGVGVVTRGKAVARKVVELGIWRISGLVIWKRGLQDAFGGVKRVANGFADEPCVRDNRRGLHCD